MRTLELVQRFLILAIFIMSLISMIGLWRICRVIPEIKPLKLFHRDRKSEDKIEEESETDELQLDQSLQDHIVNVPEETDDSHYEANIMKRLSDSRISIYYSNYTSSNVLVKGRRFGDYSIEISSPKATTDGIEEKSISDWEGSENFGIRYAIRVVIAGTNFLIWGNDREDALLNLIAFAAEFECNYF